MKKILFAIALIMTGFVSAHADDRERAITVEQLPKAAQEFLATHFKNLTVAYVVEETKQTGPEYEVTYTDRTDVEFRTNGEWSTVERKYSAVPATIIPKQIAEFVAKNNYPNQYIRKIDRGLYSWEIELSGGLEIKFDKQFNVIGYDD